MAVGKRGASPNVVAGIDDALHSSTRQVDLFELCELFAQMLAGPVAIEDPDFRLVAYSTKGDSGDEYRRRAILQRRTITEFPEWLTANGLLAQLRSSDEPLLIEKRAFARASAARYVAAVLDDSTQLGIVLACEGPTGFPLDAKAMVAEFAQLAAPGLAERRLLLANRSDHVSALLSDLLEGSQDAGVFASSWNATADAGVLLCALQPVAGGCAGVYETKRAVSMMVGSLGLAAATAAIGSVVYVLASCQDSDAAAAERTASKLTVIGDRVKTMHDTSVVIAVGTPCRLGDVRQSRPEVDRVLRALQDPRAQRTVASHADLAGLISLIELEDFFSERPYLRRGKLQGIIEHDHLHGTAYVETLRAFLRAFGQVRVAADRLCLHPNSFRYRLRRLGEIFQIDLDNPDERLALELQLRYGGHDADSHRGSWRSS
jgi:PucR C-terminal helix-turn-helix domain